MWSFHIDHVQPCGWPEASGQSKDKYLHQWTHFNDGWPFPSRHTQRICKTVKQPFESCIALQLNGRPPCGFTNTSSCNISLTMIQITQQLTLHQLHTGTAENIESTAHPVWHFMDPPVHQACHCGNHHVTHGPNSELRIELFLFHFQLPDCGPRWHLCEVAVLHRQHTMHTLPPKRCNAFIQCCTHCAMADSWMCFFHNVGAKGSILWTSSQLPGGPVKSSDSFETDVVSESSVIALSVQNLTVISFGKKETSSVPSVTALPPCTTSTKQWQATTL